MLLFDQNWQNKLRKHTENIKQNNENQSKIHKTLNIDNSERKIHKMS